MKPAVFQFFCHVEESVSPNGGDLVAAFSFSILRVVFIAQRFSIWQGMRDDVSVPSSPADGGRNPGS